jgi:hypothetical protein
MRHAIPIVIAFSSHEDLRFLHEPPERLTMDNPVAIPLEASPEAIFRV